MLFIFSESNFDAENLFSVLFNFFYNGGRNNGLIILRLFNILPNSSFATRDMGLDYS